MNLVKMRKLLQDLIESETDADLYLCPSHFPEFAPYVVVALVTNTPLDKVSNKVLELIDFEIADQALYQKPKRWYQW